MQKQKLSAKGILSDTHGTFQFLLLLSQDEPICCHRGNFKLEVLVL